MPKDNGDFFKHKKIWSEVKDELLGCYLVPYFTKVLSLGNPILYVDCFAGKGKFEDGKYGSPLTALESLDRSFQQCVNTYFTGKMPVVHMKFIELNHWKDLETNLPAKHRIRCEVIGGRFEDSIIPILQHALTKNHSLNVFLYIDPYGVKVLNTALFDALVSNFSTAELLINLNSFGFIREACRVRKISFREREDEVFGELDEYDSSVLDTSQELNDIAGGDYWQSIIDAYSTNMIDCYQAEKIFSHKYKERLRQSYTYVLDMPIRLKPGQHPKYRLVHATNHPDGCILMADNIAKRTIRLVIDIQGGGQQCLWPRTADNEVISDKILSDQVMTMLDRTTTYTRLNKFLADYYNEYGVLCDLSRLCSGRGGSILKTLEKNGTVEVQRTPNITDTGKPSAFWQEGKGKTLCLRKRVIKFEHN